MNSEPTLHLLPPLPYPLTALAPHIDAQTLHYHHGVHHAGYVRALNKALEPVPELAGKSAEWLLLNLHRVPQKIRTGIAQNAGGHLNHSLLWSAMTPTGGGAPEGLLANAITLAFGSFEAFRQAFEDTGNGLFGSGWVWLVAPSHGDRRLQIAATSGHDNPLVENQYPILVNDVWEHAYYLQHQNRRAEYLRDWWSIVDWREAERRYGSLPYVSNASSAPQVHAMHLTVVQ